jgi:hypothetical protein
MGGMVVCDSYEQAEMMSMIFKKKYFKNNAISSVFVKITKIL